MSSIRILCTSPEQYTHRLLAISWCIWPCFISVTTQLRSWPNHYNLTHDYTSGIRKNLKKSTGKSWFMEFSSLNNERNNNIWVANYFKKYLDLRIFSRSKGFPISLPCLLCLTTYTFSSHLHKNERNNCPYLLCPRVLVPYV